MFGQPDVTVVVRRSDGSQLYLPFKEEESRAYLAKTLPLLADPTAVITVTTRTALPEPNPGQVGAGRKRVTTTVSHIPVNTIASVDVVTESVESAARSARTAPAA